MVQVLCFGLTLQASLHCRAVALPYRPACTAIIPCMCCRDELDKVVPKPTTHFTTFDARPAVGVIGDSLSWLNWTKEHLLRPAKRCVL